MNGVFHIGATGLQAQQRGLDSVANNIANLNTPGFKRSSVSFSELMAVPSNGGDVLLDVSRLDGSLSGVRAQLGLRDFGQGEIRQTGSMQDVAIDGAGFIELLGPGGQIYLWRGGALKVNADGFLAASNGMPLRAMISVTPEGGDVRIGYDGVVRNGSNATDEWSEIGRIDLVNVTDTSSLAIAGEGLYEPASELDLVAGVPGEDGLGVILQGAVESSNVVLTEEMVTLLLMQRAFTANAQVVQAGDQLMSIINNLRR